MLATKKLENRSSPTPNAPRTGWKPVSRGKLFDRYTDRFETIYRFEKFNVSFVDLIRQFPTCFRSKVDDFDELIVRSIEVLLRKR